MTSVSVSGGELDAVALQTLAQRTMIFDDAVVHQGQALAGDVRMGVALAGRAVGRPAGVGDAAATGRRGFAGGVDQLADFALAAQAVQAIAVIHRGQAGGIVAAVFQTLESLQKSVGDFNARRGGGDSTHIAFSRLFCRREVCGGAASSRKRSFADCAPRPRRRPARPR